MKKLNNNDFINRSIEIHGNKYNYEKTLYLGNKDKVIIICNIHGEFTQEANSHLKGKGCSKCSGKYSISHEEFIEIANKLHKNQFLYNKVEYVNKATKVTITCNIHGDFEQTPKKHLSGQRCPKCSGTQKYTLEEFIRLSNIKHNNKYNYEKSEYINGSTITTIICDVHGEFKQLAKGHLLGYGCMSCSGKERLTNNKFIENANKIHYNKYNYDLIEYKNSNSILSIICNKHGIFEQRASTHLTGCGCPKCNESKGESKISFILDQLNIKYLREYKFIDCISINKLRFDFYLPDYNTCVEYNGRQHYESVECFGGVSEFKNIQKRDTIKRNYCDDNGIRLITIKYDENISDKIEQIKNPS